MPVTSKKKNLRLEVGGMGARFVVGRGLVTGNGYCGMLAPGVGGGGGAGVSWCVCAVLPPSPHFPLPGMAKRAAPLTADSTVAEFFAAESGLSAKDAAETLRELKPAEFRARVLEAGVSLPEELHAELDTSHADGYANFRDDIDVDADTITDVLTSGLLYCADNETASDLVGIIRRHAARARAVESLVPAAKKLCAALDAPAPAPADVQGARKVLGDIVKLFPAERE